MGGNIENRPILKALVKQFRHNLLTFMQLRSEPGPEEVLRAASKALERHDFVRSVDTYLLEKERLRSVSSTGAAEDLSLATHDHPAVRALSHTPIRTYTKEGYVDFAAAVGMPPGPAGVVHASLTCDDDDTRLLTGHLLAAVSDRLRLLQVPRAKEVAPPAPDEPPAPDARDDLFACVIHEISNPLAAILAHLDILRMERSEDPVVAGHLKSVMPQLARLCGILDSARTYTRAGLEPEGAVDVAKGLHSLAGLLRYHYHGHNVELELTVPRKLPAVRGSSGRLQQVWLNYLNAWSSRSSTTASAWMQRPSRRSTHRGGRSTARRVRRASVRAKPHASSTNTTVPLTSPPHPAKARPCVSSCRRRSLPA